MSGIEDDPLWPHFRPLWEDFQQVEVADMLVAGGYGLFLKQTWLQENFSSRVVVPLGQWRDARPRVTKDVDLVIGLELIGNKENHARILSALVKNEFQDSDKASGKRWQFIKPLDENRRIILELHAPRPDDEHANLQADDKRVKHNPSLGNAGIHGRTNPEAVGCELQPFRFEIERTGLTVVNPVTWSVMKLTALRDRWNQSQDVNAEEEARAFSRAQAIKHAQDVCRVVAMTTEVERDAAHEVVKAVSAAPEYLQACEIRRAFFDGGQGAGTRVVEAYWNPGDLAAIESVLNEMFP